MSRIIGYPSYGVKSKVSYRVGGGGWSNIRLPYAKVFNVEGRNIATLNNFGFPGTDVSTLKGATVVLGSSYVEAFQMQAEDVGSSYFQRNLEQMGIDSNVVNLGCSGHDPYDSWFRLKYFEDFYGLETQDVVLVLNSDNVSWFSRHPRPLVFDKADGFGREKSSTSGKLQIRLRNSSSFIELMAQLMKLSDQEDEAETEVPLPSESVAQESEQSLSQEMKDCLLAFQSSYPRFLVVSITDDPSFNRNLSDFCLEQSIRCKTENLAKPEYMINGVGHLNLRGNQALGRLMTQAYIEAFKGE